MDPSSSAPPPPQSPRSPPPASSVPSKRRSREVKSSDTSHSLSAAADSGSRRQSVDQAGPSGRNSRRTSLATATTAASETSAGQQTSAAVQHGDHDKSSSNTATSTAQTASSSNSKPARGPSSTSASTPSDKKPDKKKSAAATGSEASDKAANTAAAKARAKEEKKARRAAKVAETADAAKASGPPPSTGTGQGGKKGGGPSAAASSTATKKRSTSTAGGQKPSFGAAGASKGAEGFGAAPGQKPELEDREDKKVALFRHLYDDYRTRDAASGSHHVHPACQALGIQLRNYVICGGSARGVATLLALKEVIASYTTPPGQSLPRHLNRYLSPQIEHLDTCRALGISQRNAIRWLKVEQISKTDPGVSDSDSTSALCAAIDGYIRDRFSAADAVIADAAAARIADGDVILTFAKSAVVQRSLLLAASSSNPHNKRFRVIVADSRPLFEGRNLARGLADAGIEVSYTLVHGVSAAMKDATKVFLGAHAMLSNGRLVSRVGSALVAMTAHSAGVPVIVCCEAVKFSDRVALDSVVGNEVAGPDMLVPPSPSPSLSPAPPSSSGERDGSGEAATNPLRTWKEVAGLQLLNVLHDVTPAEYVNMVITEYGSLPPSSVPVVYGLSTSMG